MKILQSQLKQAEFVRKSYAATPEFGTTLDDVIDPKYWVHVAKQIEIGSRIEVKPDGADWLAELYVLKVDVHGVHLALLNKYELTTANKAPAVANDDEYEINFGGAAKWRVIRKSDREVMVKGLASKGECETWLAEQKAA